MSVLNIAGPEYDFGSVVFVVLQECEHRRRGFENDELEFRLKETAKAKLKKIKAAYDEFGGSPAYWKTLEHEVMETALPQYADAAQKMNEMERNSFGIWRDGDPAARTVFGIGGLVVGGVVKALPFMPSIENIFVFGLAAAGFLYPELKRYTYERRHFKMLNRLVTDAEAYQKNAKLHYMTATDIRESFHIASGDEETTTTESQKVAE
jgi:hypothetical protein